MVLICDPAAVLSAHGILIFLENVSIDGLTSSSLTVVLPAHCPNENASLNVTGGDDHHRSFILECGKGWSMIHGAFVRKNYIGTYLLRIYSLIIYYLDEKFDSH